ncbi:hypothetical protein OQA88_11008 [Cercophora sp. LCS_1]
MELSSSPEDIIVDVLKFKSELAVAAAGGKEMARFKGEMKVRQSHNLVTHGPRAVSRTEILRLALQPGTITHCETSYKPSQHGHPNPILTQIGQGLQGAIFSHPSQFWALKKPHVHPRAPVNLSEEYRIHTLVTTAFDAYINQLGCCVNIPGAFDFINANEPLGATFPAGYEGQTPMYRMERILPLPGSVRDALIDEFRDVIDLRGDEEKNKNCLVRVYLGKQGRVANWKFKEQDAPLRNFEMPLGNLVDLGVDVQSLAREMGRAFAIMHWGAGVDGDDVEFVLGTVFMDDNEVEQKQKRRTELWLLDFGQCGEVDFEEDKEVVYQRFKGVMVTGDHQLFIPHYARSPEVYAAFKEGYVQAGSVCVEARGFEGRFDVEEFMDEYEEYAEDFL